MFELINFFKRTVEPCIAMDLSAASVKILELTSSNATWCVNRYAQAYIPNGVFEGINIKDKAQLGQIIQSLCETVSLKKAHVTLSLPDAVVMSKIIQVNENLKETEIEELIFIEGENYISYAMEDVYFDFSILGPSTKKAGLLDVFLVATRQEYINERIETLALANLKVTCVDVESYTFERALPVLLQETIPATQLIAVMDVGAVYMRLYVFEGGRMIFVREEEFGGQRLMEMAMEHYHLEEADWMNMITSGIYPTDYKKKVLQPFLKKLSTQIKHEIDFFFSVTHYTEIEKLILAGGVAILPDVATWIMDAMKMPVTIAHPFESLIFSSHVNKETLLKSAPAWVGALGLAIRHETS